MLRIVCPYCGERDQVEYVYAGDATRQMPDLADADLDRWTDWVFARDNPKGEHHEYWQHVHGCRQWLHVARNTVTHEIVAVRPARERSAPGKSADPAGA
jgi:heterotetrameric sarcosine oxidase delta subunit